MTYLNFSIDEDGAHVDAKGSPESMVESVLACMIENETIKAVVLAAAQLYESGGE